MLLHVSINSVTFDALFSLEEKFIEKGENKLKELAIREGYARNLVAYNLAIFFFYFFDFTALLFS